MTEAGPIPTPDLEPTTGRDHDRDAWLRERLRRLSAETADARDRFREVRDLLRETIDRIRQKW